MDDGLNVARVVCASIFLSIFHIAPLIHSIVCCCTRKKSKVLSSQELSSLEIIERHMSEAEIENEFNDTDYPCCFGIWQSLRIYSFYGHIGIVATIGLYFLGHYGTSIRFLPSENTFVLFVDVVCFISWTFFPVLIFVEILDSYEFNELELFWTNDNYSINQYLNDLIRTPPKISIKFEVYHYISRGEDGMEKTTDFVLEEPFIFSRWEDITPDPQSLPLSNENKYIRMRLSQNIQCGDEVTQNEFNRQWAEMEAEGMAKAREFPKSKHSFHCIAFIDGFEKRIFTSLDSENSLADRPRWMKRKNYVLASVLGFTWFYRLAFKRSTQKTACRITKAVYLY